MCKLLLHSIFFLHGCCFLSQINAASVHYHHHLQSRCATGRAAEDIRLVSFLEDTMAQVLVHSVEKKKNILFLYTLLTAGDEAQDAALP